MSTGSPRLIYPVAALVLVLSSIVLYRINAGWQPQTQPSATIPTLKLDPNTAPWEELACLPQLGPSIAKRIVAYRKDRQAAGTHRPFATEADLDKVTGIGPRTLEEIRPYLHYAPN